MIQELKLKRDFGRTVERFEAWWVGEIVDRPPVNLWVHSDRPDRGPTKKHATLRERWLDIEFAVESAIGNMERAEYAGDSFPLYYANVGPELNATLLGCELEFSEHSSWSTPIVHEPEQWSEILNRPLNFDNLYWQTIERMTDLAIERAEGRYIVGIPDLHDNYDLLAALRDPQMLCMDLMDCPEMIERLGRVTTRVFIEMFNRLWTKTRAAGMPASTWTPALHRGPYYVPSCDFWCMVSDQIARDLILPDIRTEMEALDRSIFHLDGPQALRHLDLLLEIPNLNAVQWVFGAGNGPAARWIDVYRRCQQAGKGIQVLADNAQDALTVLEQLNPKGVWLSVGGGFPSVEEANAFLKQVERIATQYP